MLETNDKLYAAVVIFLLGLVTLLSPGPDTARLIVMATLCGAAFLADRIL